MDLFFSVFNTHKKLWPSGNVGVGVKGEAPKVPDVGQGHDATALTLLPSNLHPHPQLSYIGLELHTWAKAPSDEFQNNSALVLPAFSSTCSPMAGGWRTGIYLLTLPLLEVFQAI